MKRSENSNGESGKRKDRGKDMGRFFDKNKDGKVSFEEFADTMHMLNLLSDEEDENDWDDEDDDWDEDEEDDD